MAKRLADLESAEDAAQAPAAEAPPVMPPPGTPARFKTTVDWQANINPGDVPANARYGSELEDLAAVEDEHLAPPDPLARFVDDWRDYEGAMLRISRLPDPAARRLRGQTYNRPWFGEVEILGETPFNPSTLINDIQYLNGNSGGIFRIWLADEYGRPIPGARLERVAIGDPPRLLPDRSQPLSQPQQQYTPPPEREKSDVERRVEALQARLFENAVERAFAPPPAPIASDNPLAGLSEEDRLLLALAKNGGLFQTVTQRITEMTQASERALNPEKESWKERGINAAIGLIEQNPEIVGRVSGLLERLVSAILPDPNRPQVFTTPPPPVPQTRYNPQPTMPPPQQLANTNAPSGLPEAPDPDEDADEDEDIMDILDRLFELFTDTRPITTNDPVFVELRQAYPIKFKMAVALIQNASEAELVAWIASQSPLYHGLLTSEATATHYIGRIRELKTLIDSLANAKQAAQPAPQSTAPTASEVTNNETAPA